jgi:hypothetical protein
MAKKEREKELTVAAIFRDVPLGAGDGPDV